MSLAIRAPNSNSDFAQRSKLLQRTMRHPEDPFAIETEYPIVLDPHSSSLSLCGFESGELVAHLNVWPRLLTSQDETIKIPVALVGNVASREDVRGRGYTQALFAEAERLAKLQGIAAFFLWSDLHQFYQKLGFTSASRELRMTIPVPADFTRHPPVVLLNANTLKADDFQTFLRLRPKLPYTIERSPEEFARLTTIPATYLFASDSPKAFCVLGKGVDMQGVVHEWGAASPAELAALVQAAGQYLGLGDVMVLAPETIDASWRSKLADYATQTELHNMAYVKALRQDQSLNERLKQCFIWGLDSI